MALWTGCQATTSSRMVTMVADRGDSEDKSKQDGDWNIKGPTERLLRARNWEREKETAIAQGNESAIDGLTEYQAAEDLYKDGKYREAEKAFKALSKQRRESYETFGMKWDRWWGVKASATWDPYSSFGDPIEEDAMFMTAESRFAQKKYSWAQDSYDELLNRYPSTRHLDHVTRQLFRISRYWLDFKEQVEDNGDVQVASAEEGKAEQLKPRRAKSGITPNLFDRTRPVFDPDGRALQALRTIWLHDATGPLADDALMLSANYHLRTGDFPESARLYKLLREQYPDSQHFQDAFLLGSHVTLASYQGPGYDGKSLDESIKLKEAALRIFPDLDDDQRQRLASELRKMHDAEVERVWDKVEFYQAKGYDKSVALYCNVLIHRFPNSPYAQQAQDLLDKQARDAQLRSNARGWLPDRDSKPLARPTPQEQDNIDREVEEDKVAEEPIQPKEPPPEPAPKPKEPRRFQFPNPLRRAPKEPSLQAPEEKYEPQEVAPASGKASLDDEG
jgi:hypothetical protein